MLISFNVTIPGMHGRVRKRRIIPFIGGSRPFRDCEFAFVHPKKMNGVLLELIDYKWEELKGR